MPLPGVDMKNVAQEIRKVKPGCSEDNIPVSHFQTFKMFSLYNDFSFPPCEVAVFIHGVDQPVKGAQIDM